MTIVRYALVGLLLIPVACRDLGAVNSISGKVVSASATWDDVGRELAKSCGRTSQFNVTKTCVAETAAAEGVAAADLILRNYFSALADASNGRSLSVQGGLNSLSASIGKIPVVDAGKVTAVASLGSFLAERAAMAARERTVAELLERAPAARIAIGILDTYVVGAVTQTLKAERIELRSHFEVYLLQTNGPARPDLSRTCDTPGPRSTQFNGAGFLLVTDYCRRMDRIEAESAALIDYRKSLDKADEALTDMTSGKGRLSTKAVISQLFSVGKELDADVAAVNVAFAKG